MIQRETPDGRYVVIEGRLWRRANPALAASERAALTRRLDQARAAVLKALREGNQSGVYEAKRAVRAAKEALGERGAPWWNDGAPDYNKKLISKTPYAEWYAHVAHETRETQLYWPEAPEARA